jgi:mannan endo-1,4-beta-mannosidase
MRGRIPTDFDEEYFLNMQWAHLASGGAGGGFRWPYRHPHTLTSGMRVAQLILATLAEELDWSQFDRQHLSQEVKILPKKVKALACGNSRQVLLWLVRPGYSPVQKNSNVAVNQTLVTLKASILQSGIYRIRAWDPLTGKQESDVRIIHSGKKEFTVQLPLSQKSLVVLATLLS